MRGISTARARTGAGSRWVWMWGAMVAIAGCGDGEAAGSRQDIGADLGLGDLGADAGDGGSADANPDADDAVGTPDEGAGDADAGPGDGGAGSDADGLDPGDAADGVGDGAGGADSDGGGPTGDAGDASDASVPATADWCALVAPIEEALVVGGEITAIGRVRVDGWTDASAGVDPVPGLVAQAGWGPDGADPAGDDGAWLWWDGAGVDGWDDADAPGADEYAAVMQMPAAGIWDAAWRFSTDDGASWIYCDASPDVAGYDLADAGQIAVVPDPCDPDPCAEAPPATCEGDVLTLWSPDGACTVSSDFAAECDFARVDIDCAASLGTCDAELGGCAGGAVPPSPGELVIAEILRDPAAVPDTAGEWIEIVNVTDRPLVLDGCVLRGDTGAGHTIVAPSPVFALPGEPVLLARSGDAETNGLGPDIAPAYPWGTGLSLANAAGSVAVECGAQIIDQVTWDGEWLTAGGVRSAIGGAGVAIQLADEALTADGNDAAGAWCDATEVFGAGDRGTPGAANTGCVVIRPVDWCRLQWPESVEIDEGADVTVWGRVYLAGLTDLTGAVDAAAHLVGEVGYGPDGTDPTTDDTGWTWLTGAPNAAWDGVAAGEPDNDEYEATFPAPAEGSWDYAWRFSADGGQTWTWCDGGAGSTDGYAAAEAGQMVTTVFDPCDPDPCGTPADATCTDGVLVTETGPATCEAVDGTAACTFPQEATDCWLLGGSCDAPTAACVGVLPRPTPGQVIFTEIMANPSNPSDPDGEWVELRNVTGSDLTLSGCSLSDGEATRLIDLPVTVPAGGYVVLAHGDHRDVTGFVPDFVYGDVNISLANSAGDDVTLTCPDAAEAIDAVDFRAAGFPSSQDGRSLQLDPTVDTAAGNDDGAAWCAGRLTFASGDYGTPGGPNPTCSAANAPDWCRLQWPLSIDGVTGTDVVVYGRVFEAGLTDATTGTDASAVIVAHLGYGPVGSDPAAPDSGWTWIPAGPNPDWVDTAEAGNDEYQATLTLPAPGAWDYAYRFSADGGLTAAHCDGPAGIGADGSEDGYQPANAGVLNSTPWPECVPNPCTAPPEATCDGQTLSTPPAEGNCSVDAAAVVVCEYPVAVTDCAALGGTCDAAAGTCAGVAPAPAPGELVVTEIQIDPTTPEDPAGEWFEVHNPTATQLNLMGCTLSDGEGIARIVEPLLVAPGGWLVLAHDDTSAITGIAADLVYGALEPSGGDIFLENGGDELTIACDDGAAGTVIIDEVAWVDAAPFPVADPGVAIQLRPGSYDAGLNDAGDSWCEASTAYGGGDVGSPGAENPACPVDPCAPNPCTAPPEADRCDGDLLTAWPNPGVCSDGGGVAACDYASTTIDCAARGGTCDAASAACVGTAPWPAAGDMVVAEILFDPGNPADPDGEWIELKNVTGGPLNLAGCVLTDGEGSFTVPTDHLVAAGASVVFAYGDNTGITGFTPDFVYGGASTTPKEIELSNTADNVAFNCAGDAGPVGIDVVAWDTAAGWPGSPGRAIQLDPASTTAAANDSGDAWCVAEVAMAGGDRGTPGADNPSCGFPEVIDWCRLQWPPTVDVPAGVDVAVYARVYEAGITDASVATDPDPQLVAQVGYGARDSDPEAGGWTWLPATANATWDGAAAGEPDNDEYEATFPAPAAGDWDYAARFSADGGTSWTVCDLDDSTGGYDAAQAGKMTTWTDPCVPNPCTAPPGDACLDASTLQQHPAVGSCTDDAGAAVCDYTPTTVDCSADGRICDAATAACYTPPPAGPAPGELVFTEVMYDAPAASEWFELVNTTGGTLELAGCRVTDGEGDVPVDGSLPVPAGGYAVFVAEADLQPGTPAADFVYGGLSTTGSQIILGNAGDDLELWCADGAGGERLVDAIAWVPASPWPTRQASRSIQLHVMETDADANDAGAAWCIGQSEYAAGFFGTPGLASDCPAREPVDACRLQWPDAATVTVGEPVDSFGRVFEAGITDLTVGVDADPSLLAEACVGPDASDPSLDDTGWICASASGTPAWDGSAWGEPDHDEYTAPLTLDSAGEYDLAFRFSADGGLSWTWCDRAAGPGSDGAEDGYQPANAGQLTVVDPCTPNPCAATPASSCAGEVLSVYPAPGRCEVVAGAADCTYPPTTIDCASLGTTCDGAAGWCVGVPPAPAVTEVAFTEVMANPATPGDPNGEWVEVFNAAGMDLLLTGCVLSDGEGVVVIDDPLVLPTDGYAVLAYQDNSVTTGWTPDFTYAGRSTSGSEIQLANGGDDLTLTCPLGGGDVPVDVLVYDDSGGWPSSVNGAAIALDPSWASAAADPASNNDDGAQWCRATTAYGGGDLGTPGAVNDACF